MIRSACSWLIWILSLLGRTEAAISDYCLFLALNWSKLIVSSPFLIHESMSLVFDLDYISYCYFCYLMHYCYVFWSRKDFQSKESVRNFNWKSTWLILYIIYPGLTFTVAAYDCLNQGHLSESCFSAPSSLHKLIIWWFLNSQKKFRF